MVEQLPDVVSLVFGNFHDFNRYSGSQIGPGADGPQTIISTRLPDILRSSGKGFLRGVHIQKATVGPCETNVLLAQKSVFFLE